MNATYKFTKWAWIGFKSEWQLSDSNVVEYETLGFVFRRSRVIDLGSITGARVQASYREDTSWLTTIGFLIGAFMFAGSFFTRAWHDILLLRGERVMVIMGAFTLFLKCFFKESFYFVVGNAPYIYVEFSRNSKLAAEEFVKQLMDRIDDSRKVAGNSKGSGN